MFKKILSTIGVLLGVLLLLAGVLVLLLSNATFFGTAVTWVLCGCVAALMLFVIYIGVTRIIDVLGKRQSDEEIIEEQHLKNIFTNEIALKQQTISMTAINPAVQQTATKLDKTAILNAQKAAENKENKKAQAKEERASRKMYGKKQDVTIQNEMVENIYRTAMMDAQAPVETQEQDVFVEQEVPAQQGEYSTQETVMAQETSANIWDQMDVQKSAEPAAVVYSTSGKLPITGPTPAQKAAAMRFQNADVHTGTTLFDEEEVQDAAQNIEETKTAPMPMPTRVTHRQVTRPPLNRQVHRAASSQTVAGTVQNTTTATTASAEQNAVRAEYEGSKENTRITRRPVSRRPVAQAQPVTSETVDGEAIVASATEQSVTSQPVEHETVQTMASEVVVNSEEKNSLEGKTTSSLVQEKALALEKTMAEITAAMGKSSSAEEEAPAEPVKRGRGRPKKVKTPEELAAEAAAAAEPKRGPGRPPKELTPEEIAAMNAPKRPRGRPAKVLTAEEIAAMNAPKRPRGRPKKVEVEAEAQPESATAETEV